MKKVKVIYPFTDLLEEEERTEGDIFICDEDRAKELKELKLVWILSGDVKPDNEAAVNLSEIPADINEPDDEIKPDDLKNSAKGKK